MTQHTQAQSPATQKLNPDLTAMRRGFVFYRQRLAGKYITMCRVAEDYRRGDASMKVCTLGFEEP